MHPPYQQPSHHSTATRQGLPTGVKALLAGCGGCSALLGLFVVAGCVAAVVAPDTPTRPAPSASSSASPSVSVSPVEEAAEPSSEPAPTEEPEEPEFPPALEGEARSAYLAAVREVDPGFVFPDADSVVARGQDVCVTLRDEGEQAAVGYIETVWLHEEYDFGARPTTTEEAEELLGVVHEHVCPDW